MGDSPNRDIEGSHSLNIRNKQDSASRQLPERAEWPEFTFMGLKMSDDNDNLTEVCQVWMLSFLERSQRFGY
jgi:hypothetical protein